MKFDIVDEIIGGLDFLCGVIVVMFITIVGLTGVSLYLLFG